LLEERLERQRVLYNAALQERCDAWRLARKAIGRLDQQKSLTAIRVDDPQGHGKDPANLGRWTLKRVEDAFTGFFSRVKHGRKAGFPRFKSKSRWRSFGLMELKGLRLEGDRVFLKGMDRGIRLNPGRRLPADAKILGVTFTRYGRDWHLGFTIETQDVVAASHAHGGAVGVDLGVEVLATLSTGERIPNVRPQAGMEREIRKCCRAVSRCRRGSRGYRKAREKLARKTRKVARIRADHLHRTAARLSALHGLIAMEDLRVSNMTSSAAGTKSEPNANVAQKRGLNRSILDAGWSMFVDMVRYKAERAGGVLVLVDAKYTSVECSGCGAHVPKALSQRRHRCECGIDLHRDENAARVIRARGLVVQAASEGGRPLGDANVGHKAVRRPKTLLAA
jgi:putative transposase